MPLAFAVNGPFLLAYAALAKRGWWQAMVPALGIWFGLSYLIIVFRLDNFFWGVGICGLVLTLVTIIFERTFNALSTAGQRADFGWGQLLTRALFAGLIIGTAVLASRFLNPLFGGILASFPAVFVSTLIILHRSRGAAVSVGLAKSLLISGSVNVISYIVAIRYLYGSVGLYWGTLLGLLVSLFSAYLTHRFIMQKLK